MENDSEEHGYGSFKCYEQRLKIAYSNSTVRAVHKVRKTLNISTCISFTVV